VEERPEHVASVHADQYGARAEVFLEEHEFLPGSRHAAVLTGH
jgi:hypothetical protein